MTRAIEYRPDPASKERWLAVVICEDEPAHARALAICERVARQFWDEIEFKFRWWTFASLGYPANATEASHDAGSAEMVFFAAQGRGDLPARVKSWIETWANTRTDRGGALIYLAGDEDPLEAEVSLKQLYLRQVAHRAEMDFLCDVPEHLAPTIPESPEWFTDRASEVGPVMDGILRQTEISPTPAFP